MVKRSHSESSFPGKHAGIALRGLREAAGITQQQLADYLMLKNQSSVAFWEGGKHLIPQHYLPHIREVLGLDDERYSQLCEAHRRDRSSHPVFTKEPDWLEKQPQAKQAGLLLKAYCERASVSQSALAEELGIAHSFVSFWVNGKQGIPLKHLSLIRRKLDLSEDETVQLRTAILQRRSMKAESTKLGSIRPFENHKHLGLLEDESGKGREGQR